MTKETKTSAQILIIRIWDLEEQWKRINDPQLNWYGNMTFRRLSEAELDRSVRVAELEKRTRKELRALIGTWEYVRFIFNEARYMKNLCL